MRTLPRYQQQEVEPGGRFGRTVRIPAADDVQMDDARTTMHDDCADARLEMAKYEVDADAVAAAIVDRLLAGRTLPLPSDD